VSVGIDNHLGEFLAYNLGNLDQLGETFFGMHIPRFIDTNETNGLLMAEQCATKIKGDAFGIIGEPIGFLAIAIGKGLRVKVFSLHSIALLNLAKAQFLTRAIGSRSHIEDNGIGANFAVSLTVFKVIQIHD
jgi:hypothetical protein